MLSFSSCTRIMCAFSQRTPLVSAVVNPVFSKLSSGPSAKNVFRDVAYSFKLSLFSPQLPLGTVRFSFENVMYKGGGQFSLSRIGFQFRAWGLFNAIIFSWFVLIFFFCVSALRNGFGNCSDTPLKISWSFLSLPLQFVETADYIPFFSPIPPAHHGILCSYLVVPTWCVFQVFLTWQTRTVKRS